MDTAEARTTSAGEAGGPVYDAFLSYSHAADELLAPRLQAGLQRFAKPWWKRRALRIFRDEASLSANPHLWSSITKALDESGWFILLLSPDAADSEWVDREVEYWLANKDPERIIPVLTEGDFTWYNNGFISDAAPPALGGAFSDEPRWVDLRFARSEEQLDLKNPRFSAAVADIASAVRGVPKDELESEEVQQHRRTVRTAWAAAFALMVLAVTAGGAAIYAVGQRNEAQTLADSESQARLEADAQRQVAEVNAVEAERQAAVARSRELAAAAVGALDEDPELSMLLSLQSIHATPQTATASPAGVLALRDAVAANRLLARFPVPRSAHNFAAISADGSTIFHSSGPDRAVTALDAVTGSVLWTYHDPTTVDAFNHVSLSPDDTLVAVSILDQPLVVDASIPVDDEGNDALPPRVVVLDARSGEVVRTLTPGECPAATTEHAGFSPDGKWLAIGTGDRTCGVEPNGDWITVYDTETWEEAHRLVLGEATEQRISFSADSQRIVLSGTDQFPLILPTITDVYSFPDLELIAQLPGAIAAALSPDGVRLALLPWEGGGDIDLRPQLLDVDTGERIGYLDAVDDAINALQFSTDGTKIAATTRADDLVFDAENAQLLATFGGAGFTNSMSFTADGTRLLTTHDADLLLWDVTGSATEAGTPLQLPGDWLGWINPDWAVEGPRLAVNSLAWEEGAPGPGGLVTLLLDPDTGATLDYISGWSGQLPDGRFVVNQWELGGEDPQVGPFIVWDPVSGIATELEPCVASFSELAAGGEIDCPGGFFAWDRWIVASSDGAHFLASSYAPAGSMRTVRVWDVATLNEVSEFQIPRDHDLQAAGTGWAAAQDATTRSLLVYDIQSGAIIAEPQPSAEFEYLMTTTPDGTILFIEDSSRTALWGFDTSTWEPVANWETHDAFHRGLAVSPDGDKLVTTGEDNLVKVWDISNIRSHDTGPPPLLDRIPAEFPSDAVWLSEDRLMVFLAQGPRQVEVSIAIDEVVSQATDRLTRSFTPGECATYRIDPCPALEDIKTGSA